MSGAPAALVAAARGEPSAGRLHVSGDPRAVAQLAAILGLPDQPAS